MRRTHSCRSIARLTAIGEGGCRVPKPCSQWDNRALCCVMACEKGEMTVCKLSSMSYPSASSAVRREAAACSNSALFGAAPVGGDDERSPVSVRKKQNSNGRHAYRRPCVCRIGKVETRQVPRYRLQRVTNGCFRVSSVSFLARSWGHGAVPGRRAKRIRCAWTLRRCGGNLRERIIFDI